MALVTVTVRDEEDGTVSITMNSEPPFHMKKPEKNTSAQATVLTWLADSLEDAAEQVHSVDVDE